MFTGIIEETGILEGISKGSKSARLIVHGDLIFSDLRIGESVCTNGVCLTVINIEGKRFMADVMNETLQRTTLGGLRGGAVLNLERAMGANGRFGGHIVSGHVDGVGKITSIIQDDIAVWYKILAPREIMKYVIEKGSIAIEGISLTVAKTERDYFSVSLIPHTAKFTNISGKKIGDCVNLEGDIIGRYIERFMSAKEGITQQMLL